MAAKNQVVAYSRLLFQHTATRRWLPSRIAMCLSFPNVSTHSHPKVAACQWSASCELPFSFNTQPPEGGCNDFAICCFFFFSFNTQPPEGGCVFLMSLSTLIQGFQHTATRRWLLLLIVMQSPMFVFQHTATRRWLRELILSVFFSKAVSTHSHPKVAATLKPV